MTTRRVRKAAVVALNILNASTMPVWRMMPEKDWKRRKVRL